jgi:hypothetical protein
LKAIIASLIPIQEIMFNENSWNYFKMTLSEGFSTLAAAWSACKVSKAKYTKIYI